MRWLTYMIGLVALGLTTWGYAQTPQSISYQGVALYANQQMASNQELALRISLLPGEATADAIYVETHSTTTDANGFFSIAIGQGVRMGMLRFDQIDWGAGPYFIKTEVDLDGGYDYRFYGTTQLLTVPYAMHSHRSSHVQGVADSLTRLNEQQHARYHMLHRHIDSVVGQLQQQVLHCLPGAFSVATGKTVRFAPGNLQYCAHTDQWRFARHQYDIVGDSNRLISSNNTHWIDLYGRGTSGWRGGAAAYLPYAASTTGSDYIQCDLADRNRYADWGQHNAIGNGGRRAGLWRCLTRGEMRYLLLERNASTIGTTSDARYSKATVEGVAGLMIFPDHYTHPDGIPTPEDINSPTASYSTNQYTSEQWDQFEAAGVVFLPATGMRRGHEYMMSANGYYWLSSHYSSATAYSLLIGTTIDPDNLNNNYDGLAVRLVCEL
ncbi:MAG: hypothetical protein IJ620_05655 [Bacteroidales bacterium]|nr:hypothetical protein [Bacteroidales bacterium]